MPTGSASNDGATGNDGRDALDMAVSKTLQRARRPQGPLPAAAPEPDAPQDEILLQYIDGALDKDTHAEVEIRLLADHVTRGRVALLRSALAEPQPQQAPPAACSRYLFAFSQGKLRFLRGPSDPLPPPESSPTQQTEIGFQLPARGASAELRLCAAAGGIELWVPLASGGRVELRCGGAVLSADGDGRFRGLGPARYELRICLGADALPPIVLDIRGA
jgi:hypothetical protein